MKTTQRLLITLLLVSALLATALPAAAQEITPDPAAEARIAAAKDFVNLLIQGQFEQASQAFPPELQPKAPPSMLQEAWSGLLKQLGAYQQITEATPTHELNVDMVYLTTEFAKGSVDLRFVFDQNGKIAGMQFLPAGTGRAALQPYQTAPYVKPGSFTEQEVTVGAPGFPLPGILTLPTGEGPFPAIVLVHGSGPNDRDETIYNNKPFRDLAEGLASQGIAVLRYDKRTKIYAEQMGQDLNSITADAEAVDDALAGIQFLQNTPGVDPQRVFLLGHSLGGMLVPRIAADVPGLAGAVVLAGPTRPLEDIIVDQITYLNGLQGTLTPEIQAQIEQTKAQAAKVKDPNLSIDTPPDQLLGIPATWWLSLRGYNPAETAKTLAIPLLILRGERDYQVSQADFDGWQAALGEKASVILKQYPGLNHLFISGVGQPNPQEYQKAGHVAQAVVDDIASFINTGKLSAKTALLGGTLTTQDITRLALLILPILLVQAALSIYALVDLAKRQKTHGPRWMWFVLLIITLFAVPTGLIVAGIYLVWARKEAEEDGDGDDDTD